MSYITDELRAPRREAEGIKTVPGQTLEELVAANPGRRRVLRGSLGMSLLSAFGGGSLLAACGGDDNPAPAPAQGPAPAPAPGPTPQQPLDYNVTFKGLDAKITANQVTVPATYETYVLFSAGDPVAPGAAGYKGAFQTSTETEQQAGGNHDGMHFFEIPGVDPQKGGLLVINHEAPDAAILMSGSYNAVTATPEQKRLVLSSVGVSVIEIELVAGKWEVKRNSLYNKRYSGNTAYRVSGPATTAVGPVVIGTLNNCSSGHTPWGTYLTCEETTDNYLDPTQAEEGYGWVVEIDPLQQLSGLPVKRTAMGRFDHENTAFMTTADNRVAFYMGDDGTPGCIYKFIPSAAFDATNRLNNASLLDTGTLYAAKFNGDGTGEWIELTQGKNGLVAGASDPGNWTQAAPGVVTPVNVDFNTQADVLVNTKAAARVAGATLMDRPEWITVGQDRTVYCTLTNNGSRVQTDAANPRPNNSHGHIIRWREDGDSPLATKFKWEILLLAGDPSIAAANLKGNMVGATFSSPDGIRVDPKGRLWVQTDAGTGSSVTNIFGANSMHYVDQVTKEVRRLLVGPVGCEITGLAYTPDLTTFFINIQHPTGTGTAGGNWPDANLPSRSSTVVVRHREGKPVGA
ncbi:PhoX family protein [Cupriavidus pauculus]|uniref:PhoX family protein n=1 Tax=Cupriavidus pauculus TaxID=82633 RepID=UPI003857E32A